MAVGFGAVMKGLNMSYPHQPWPPPGSQPGQPQNFGGYPQPGYPPGYGPPAPRINLATLDRTKLAAVVVLACGLIVLIGSLFALYSVSVTPSALATRGNDSPSGSVDLGVGFYDIVPFAPPIVAEAIPVLMVLAALTAVPLLVRAPRRPSATPAVLAGTAALLSIVLAISGPLPSVDVSGQMAAKLSEENGGQTINSMIDAVVSVSPGAGLVIAIIFSLIGWVAAASLIFQRNTPAAAPFAPQPGPRSGPMAPPSPTPW
jgi:hypothetical protein